MMTRGMRLNARAGGFTLVELIIVIVIAGILMAYAMPQLQRSRAEREARNARDVFAWMAQRARTRAIQKGEAQLLHINPSTQRMWIAKYNPKNPASDTLESAIHFPSRYATTFATEGNSSITLCYGSRGYAFKAAALQGSNWECKDTPAQNVVTFTHAGRTSTALLRATGQVERR